MVPMEQVAITGYLARETKIRLKTELARKEMAFSAWLREHAEEWLAEKSGELAEKAMQGAK